MKPNADKEKIARIEESIQELSEIIADTECELTREEASAMRWDLQHAWERETGEYWYDLSADEIYGE